MKKKSYPIQLRFADIDVMGHVNNANYLHYFETARMHFFNEHLGDWDWKRNGLVLAKNEVHYKIPVTLENTIRVDIFCEKIGDKSFTLGYHVINEKDQLCASGSSVGVCFNYEEGQSIEIPMKLKGVLEAFLNEFG